MPLSRTAPDKYRVVFRGSKDPHGNVFSCFIGFKHKTYSGYTSRFRDEASMQQALEFRRVNSPKIWIRE